MKTTNRNSATIQWLSDVESQNSIHSIKGFQAEKTPRREDSSLRRQKSALFQIYELGVKSSN
ncbi:hypothetical protein GJU43_00745 [Flavobacterium sp. LC2016-23]|jgi:hypothetical protein|uniref:hypothetical protein n=1 Tax=Flavobacterium sp. LC2016-23 TaxID=2666330 RepID=UPI0012B086E4|nr:hypothetical protein [Flavobacterium sp. LC2016-23]MRX37790.1 hypothetical protein [Flavobacterium sp. LC2016-23]